MNNNPWAKLAAEYHRHEELQRELDMLEESWQHVTSMVDARMKNAIKSRDPVAIARCMCLVRDGLAAMWQWREPT